VRRQFSRTDLVTYQAQIAKPVDVVMDFTLKPAPLDPQADANMLDACPLPPPPALDFGKFQKARARFNSALQRSSPSHRLLCPFCSRCRLLLFRSLLLPPP
jgi:hypothetical protein